MLERRPATAFSDRDAKPKATEKSWRRTLREDERDAATAAAVFGQTHAIRGRGWSAKTGNRESTAMMTVPRRDRGCYAGCTGYELP